MEASYPDWIDAFEERGAILVADAGLANDDAERAAIDEVVDAIIATGCLDNTWRDVASGWDKAGLPTAWIIGVLHLQSSSPVGDWPSRRWPPFLAAIADFCSRWALKARGLGWSEIELFGCHNAAPWWRLDGQGLALRLDERTTLVSIDQKTAMFRVGRSTQRYRHGQNAPLLALEQALIWEL